MFDQFRIFLGPARLRALFLLLAGTGFLSLVLNAVVAGSEEVIAAQSLLVVIFLVGSAIIIGGRMSREQRLRWVMILAPALGAVLLALTVLPNLALPLLGAATGWVIAGVFIFRPRVPREYQEAIKHMRRENYDDAIAAMDALIKEDRDNPDYYRLRAEIFRLWGKLDSARKDYQSMVDLVPDLAVGHNGLAEVYLQSGKYLEAREAGLKAYELAPEEWIAAYNLGMIEDRLRMSEQVVEHLQSALQHRIPDTRHRLLIHLYLARAYSRTGQMDDAREEVRQLKRQSSGLEEWQNLLRYEQAASLRAVLAEDVQTAQKLVDDEIELEALGT